MRKLYRVKVNILAEREDFVFAESPEAAKEWVRTLPDVDRDEFLKAGDFEIIRTEPHTAGEVIEVISLDGIDKDWAETIPWGDNPFQESADQFLDG